MRKDKSTYRKNNDHSSRKNKLEINYLSKPNDSKLLFFNFAQMEVKEFHFPYFLTESKQIIVNSRR